MSSIFKYFFKLMVLIFSVLFFITSNLFFFFRTLLWDWKIPTPKKFSIFNEYYIRHFDGIVYYKTFIHYVYKYKGYKKSIFK